MNNAIKYLPHAAIERQRWDHCINQAANGRIYARSIYLDAMCPGWDALVLGDYEQVFPLPHRRKWGIRYCFQPFLVAQLGLFGNGLSAGMLEDFLAAIPKKFQYLDLVLNAENNFPTSFPLFPRMNYVLPLLASHETLRSAYRQTTVRNIKKAVGLGCIPVRDIPVEQVIALAQYHTKDSGGLEQFKLLYDQLAGMAFTYGVTDAHGKLLASCVFLKDAHRVYYILVGNHPNGRTLGASHLLIDAFISDHAGTGLLLDFEGSDLRNLAFFYSSFGAREEIYPALRWNRLPWWLRWAK